MNVGETYNQKVGKVILPYILIIALNENHYQQLFSSFECKCLNT